MSILFFLVNQEMGKCEGTCFLILKFLSQRREKVGMRSSPIAIMLHLYLPGGQGEFKHEDDCDNSVVHRGDK